MEMCFIKHQQIVASNVAASFQQNLDEREDVLVSLTRQSGFCKDEIGILKQN